MQGTPWKQVQGALCKMLELTRGQGNIRWEINILILIPESNSSRENILIPHNLCKIIYSWKLDDVKHQQVPLQLSVMSVQSEILLLSFLLLIK